MHGTNLVIVTGYLGADPEERPIKDGVTVVNFSVGVTERWKGKEGEEERTEWVRVAAWRQLGEMAMKELRKGSPVYVQGRLRTRSWDDKKTGEKRYMTEVEATDIQPCKSREERGQAPRQQGAQRPTQSAQQPAQQPAAAGRKEDDDLPF